MGIRQRPLDSINAVAHPAIRVQQATRAVMVAWVLVALLWVLVSPSVVWATTATTEPAATTASSAPAGQSDGSSGRQSVPPWMFFAGGVLISVAAIWMIQANRRRGSAG